MTNSLLWASAISNPLSLNINLDQFSDTTRFLIGYSGGVDSHVLLHLLATQFLSIKNRMIAIHVHHGLHPLASEWAKHCLSVCEQLGIGCEISHVNAKPQAGESPEAAARNARYAAFAKLMQSGDCLLTAHHQDDQAETLLLQLMRGAGIKGLSSMPEFSSFNSGFHLRPLLNYTRNELLLYAKSHDLSWIEDESNTNKCFDRNYIRHTILPELKKRWPSATHTLHRVTQHCSQAQFLLEEIASSDLNSLEEKTPWGDCLNNEKLQQLSTPRRINVLRFWFHRQKLPMPNEKHLKEMIKNVIASSPDMTPRVYFSNIQLCRYRNYLFIRPDAKKFNLPSEILWDIRNSIIIPELGTLYTENVKNKGISKLKLKSPHVVIRFRQGGERYHPVGRQGSHPLKKLFQEWGVPPWERERIPLLYQNNTLIAVVGFCVSNDYAVENDDEGWVIKFQRDF